MSVLAALLLAAAEPAPMGIALEAFQAAVLPFLR